MRHSSSRFVISILIWAAFLGGCVSTAPQPEDTPAATNLSSVDRQLADQVRTALHADPYLYDKHIKVSIEQGNVVLRGFVASDWDLRNAKKIAAQAADGRRVVDNLSINPIIEPTPGDRH